MLPAGPSSQACSSSTTTSSSLPLWAALVAMGSCGAASAAGIQPLADLGDAASNAHLAESILRPLFSLFTALYIIRIPMTWYPTIDGTKMPWLISYGPTEPFLKVTRQVGG